MKISLDKIALGITDDEVPLGSHLIHFWHTDSEFERGVRFLELGIDDESQYSVLFGHDEANERVLQTLRKAGRDLDRVIRRGVFESRRRGSNSDQVSRQPRHGAGSLTRQGCRRSRRRRKWGNYVGRSVSVCDRLYVRHQHSFWTSRARRRIWSSPSRSLPWRSAGQPVLRNRKQEHSGVAPAKHDR